ncbi:MAG: GNAT family N-acetyltransferase [Rhabdaerophilum sp.]
MIPEGYTDLAPGQLAALTTYLRHDLADLPPPPHLPVSFRLERLGAAEVSRYLALFRAVGQEWLWFGRLQAAPETLAALLEDAQVEALALVGPEGDIGLLELDFRNPLEPELAYFGLVEGSIGQGLGRVLMAEALHRAKARVASHLMVHTCHFDAPGALSFYQRAGFVPYKRAIEVFRDPRLDGTLPKEAAAHLPIIE